MADVVKPAKHGRDHCPGGEDPIPCLTTANPVVMLYDTLGTSVPTATEKPIPFSEIAYSPLVTQGDVFDWEVTDTGDTGVDRFELTTIVEGWYEWELVTFWDATSTPGSIVWGYAVQNIAFSGGPSFLTFPSILAMSADWSDDLSEMLENGWISGTGKIHLPANRTWFPTARQLTGVTRSLIGVKLMVTFLGAENDADWTYDSV